MPVGTRHSLSEVSRLKTCRYPAFRFSNAHWLSCAIITHQKTISYAVDLCEVDTSLWHSRLCGVHRSASGRLCKALSQVSHLIQVAVVQTALVHLETSAHNLRVNNSPSDFSSLF